MHMFYPHHGLEKKLIVYMFYNGLLCSTRMTTYAIVGEELMNKDIKEVYALIENMAHNHYQWGGEHVHIEETLKRGGIYDVSAIDHINAKAEALFQKTQ